MQEICVCSFSKCFNPTCLYSFHRSYRRTAVTEMRSIKLIRYTSITLFLSKLLSPSHMWNVSKKSFLTYWRTRRIINITNRIVFMYVYVHRNIYIHIRTRTYTPIDKNLWTMQFFENFSLYLVSSMIDTFKKFFLPCKYPVSKWISLNKHVQSKIWCLTDKQNDIKYLKLKVKFKKDNIILI